MNKRVVVIPLAKLREGAEYIGIGRGCNTARFNDGVFRTVGYSMGFWEVSELEYGERGFSPVLAADEYLIDIEEKDLDHGTI